MEAKPQAREWYEDPHKLQEKRIELGVSVERLAKIVGRHKSYIEEIEAGHIAAGSIVIVSVIVASSGVGDGLTLGSLTAVVPGNHDFRDAACRGSHTGWECREA